MQQHDNEREQALPGQLEALAAWRDAAARRSYPEPARPVLSLPLREDGSRPGVRPAAVLAHAELALREQLTYYLARHDVDVVGAVPGLSVLVAQAAPWTVTLLFLEAPADLAPQSTVGAARLACPQALLAVHTYAPADGVGLLAAGARAVFSGDVAPVDVASSLAACLRGERYAVALL